MNRLKLILHGSGLTLAITMTGCAASPAPLYQTYAECRVPNQYQQEQIQYGDMLINQLDYDQLRDYQRALILNQRRDGSRSRMMPRIIHPQWGVLTR